MFAKTMTSQRLLAAMLLVSKAMQENMRNSKRRWWVW